METNENSPVEKPEETSGSEGKREDLIPYSTHQKLLKEKKNAQSRIEQYEQELKRLKDEKLASEGNKDQLLENYKKELDEIKDQLSNKEKTFAWKTITSSIKEEALKNGCTNPDKLVRLLEDKDLKALEVGEDYSIEPQSLKQLIEKSKSENDFLFKKTVAVADSTPNTQTPQTKPKSEKELFESYIDSIYKR